MHLNVLAGHNFQILLSTNDLPIVTNALFLCQCFAICFYQFVPIMIGKTFVKAIMVH